ncbi:MAG: ATP-binding protein [Candidatus Njordarchaeales archaeon]
MPYNIIIGRDEADRKRFGEKGTIFLGRHFVKMGPTTSLSNKILLDVARAHVILIAGKRGSGKSYTLGVIAESMANLPGEIADNLAVVIFDTMGIFWSMKYANERQESLLNKWGLQPKELDIDVYVPKGSYKEYVKKDLPVDYSFSIKTSELTSDDWCNVFEIKVTEPIGILIDRVIENLKEKQKDYDIKEIISEIRKQKTFSNTIRLATENRFIAASKWGLNSKKVSEIKDIVKAVRISVLDLSAYRRAVGAWSIKGLVIAMIARKLLAERIIARKGEELEAIREGTKFFGEKEIEEMPLVWLFLDELHEFLPRVGKNPATDALIQLLREGRQPGISIVGATQQPGEIARDMITQSDIVLSHRITAKMDLDALNAIMQTYLLADIQSYMNNLPKLKGSAIILDDNSERIYPMRVRPKMSWHGGEAPSAIKIRKRAELGLD